LCIYCKSGGKEDVPCEAFEKKCKTQTAKYVKVTKVKATMEYEEDEDGDTFVGRSRC
jgi:hypothetical protein